jgi:cyclic pyranopterin phosphate synthase
MSEPKATPTTSSLSHVDESGQARMVDVSAKADSQRVAVATGSIRMQPSTLEAIRQGGTGMHKGDVLGTARLAGVMAAKKTPDLIPLCHPLLLNDVQVELEHDESLPGVRVRVTVRTTGKTGVEMEALTAASVALLTVYDMAKAVDRGMSMGDIRLVQKSGGRSGEWSSLDGMSPAP